MARNAGPEDGAEPTPEPSPPPRDAGPQTETDGAVLAPGEPSWPEDPDRLRVEGLAAEEPAGPASPLEHGDDAVSGPVEPPRILAEEEAASETPEAEGAEPALLVGREEGPRDPADAPWTSDSQEARDGFAVPPEPQGMRPQPEPLPVSPSRGRGAGTLLLGGAVAAGLGFGAAWLARDRAAPAGLLGDLEARLAAVEARDLPDEAEVVALAERLSEVESRLATLEEAPIPTPEVPPDLAPLRDEVAAGLEEARSRADVLEERLSEVESLLATLEEAPIPTPEVPSDLAPLRDEVAAGLEEARSRADALEARLAALEARPAAPPEASAAPAEPGPALRSAPGPQQRPAAGPAGPDLEPRLDAAEESLAQAEEALGEVQSALALLDERVGGHETDISALDARLGEAEAGLEAAETRLAAAEGASAAAAEAASAAAASVAETRLQAEAAEAQARREAALTTLRTALDRGEPFDAALPDLGAEPGEALARAAAEGVPSLAALRESFPAAARAGLAAARDAGILDEDGVSGLLSGWLSVRSTAPREGSDPDAVLSRAEAALARGRLEEALAELGSLPEPVQAAMADWMTQARARAEAEAALEALRVGEPSAPSAD